MSSIRFAEVILSRSLLAVVVVSYTLTIAWVGDGATVLEAKTIKEMQHGLIVLVGVDADVRVLLLELAEDKRAYTSP